MLFGSKCEFAIEASLEVVAGAWRFGRLLLWVGGRAWGDWEETSDLASSAYWAGVFLRASGERTRPELDASSTAEVYHALYGIHMPGSGADPSAPWSERDAVVLDEVGESSIRDLAGVIAVRRGDGCDRVIVVDRKTQGLVECVVPPGRCDAVLQQYREWVETLG